MSSRGPLVKSSLFTRLTALFTNQDQLVTYGLPRILMDEIFMVGDAQADQDLAALGQRSREEVILQRLVIGIHEASDDQQTVTERAFTRMATLEADLRTDPTMGTSGSIRTAEIVEWQLTETVPEEMVEGRDADLAITIRAKARLT